MVRLRQILAALLLSVLTAFGNTAVVIAAQANSNNYGVSEVNFGSGSELRACSTLYCAKQSAGELTVGNTAGQAQTATLNPTADSYVASSLPTSNYATANPIHASSSSHRSLLKFNTSAIKDVNSVTSVTLQLYSTTAFAGGLQIHQSSDSWTEAGVNWNNQPTWNSAVLATSTNVAASTTMTINLPPSSITAAGNTNYGVDFNLPSNIAMFQSREDGTHPPVLTVNYGGQYQAEAGFNTDRQPLLEVVGPASIVNLGELSESAVTSASTTFSVRNYLASGYNVTIDGTSPKHKDGVLVLSTLTIPKQSQTGIEQFGLNLRQNTSPAIGSDPVHAPDSTFGFGTAAPGYDMPNYFKYVAGDTIAYSPKSSGQTTYTLSMIANAATTTKGGEYKGRLFINVIPTF